MPARRQAPPATAQSSFCLNVITADNKLFAFSSTHPVMFRKATGGNWGTSSERTVRLMGAGETSEVMQMLVSFLEGRYMDMTRFMPLVRLGELMIKWGHTEPRGLLDRFVDECVESVRSDHPGSMSTNTAWTMAWELDQPELAAAAIQKQFDLDSTVESRRALRNIPSVITLNKTLYLYFDALKRAWKGNQRSGAAVASSFERELHDLRPKPGASAPTRRSARR